MRRGAVFLFLLVLGSWVDVASAQSLQFLSPPQSVGSGLQASTSRVRLSTGQHGGVFVTISVSDSTVARVAPDDATPGTPSIDVFLPNGSIDAHFVVQGLEGIVGSVQIEASVPGFPSVSEIVDVVTPGYEVVGLSPTQTVFSTPDAFQVRVGIVSGAGTTVQFAQAARAGGGGIDVDLEVDVPAFAELVTNAGRGGVATVRLEEGDSSTATSVANGGVALDGVADGTVQVTALITGFTALPGASRSVTIEPGAIAFIGGATTTGSGLRTGAIRARLNGSQHGGVDVSLGVNDATLAVLAASQADTGTATVSVFVPDGSIDATFYVDGLEGRTGTAFVTAAAPGFGLNTTTVEVQQPAVGLSGVTGSQDTLDPVDPFYATVGVTSNGTTVSTRDVRRGSPGVPITFAVSDPAVALLQGPATLADSLVIVIPEGASTTPTSLAGGGVGLDGVAAGTVTVTASSPGFSPTLSAFVDVTVTEPSMTFVGLPNAVGAGLVSAQFQARLGASAHGGTVVRVESADPTRLLLSLAPSDTGTAFVEGFVSDGSIALGFYAHGVEAVQDTVEVTASAAGFAPVVSSVEVRSPGVQIEGLSGTTNTAATFDDFYARIGLPNPTMTTLSSQSIRPGGVPVQVVFGVSDSTVAELVTVDTRGGTAVLTIGENENSTPTTRSSGGVGFDGITPGQVIVSARIDGFVTMPLADRTVDVGSPTMSWIGVPTDVGAGLQTATLRVRLSGTAHGGTTVRVESSDPARLLVSPDGSTVGQGFVEEFVPDGSLDASFVLQATEGAPLTVPLTATAANFQTAQADVDIVQPGLDIQGLLTTFDVGDAIDAFFVRTGIPNSIGSFVSPQEVRAGAPPLAIDVTSAQGAVAEVVTTAGSGAMQTVFVPSGSSNTPTSVGGGGVGLRPVGAGSSVISASAPGFQTTGAGQREVTVVQGGITLTGVPFFLGGGLQTQLLTARLEDAFHGGVTLRIESSDSTRALVAPGPTTAGSRVLDIPLANGVDTAQYVLQGVAGGAGPVVVSAIAGVESGAVSFQVVDAALQIAALGDSLDVVDGADPFLVETGIASADGDSLVQRQAVGAHASPLLVSVINDVAVAGELITSAATGDSVVVAIVATQSQSPFTVGTGGISFEPRLAGPTTLRAVASGFAVTPSAQAAVVVFGDLTDAPSAPLRLSFAPNVPNPFNPATTLSFTLPLGGEVELVVYDPRGRRVRTLVDAELVAGVHEVVWNGDDDAGAQVASGVYFARLNAQGKSLQRKLVLVE